MPPHPHAIPSSILPTHFPSPTKFTHIIYNDLTSHFTFHLLLTGFARLQNVTFVSLPGTDRRHTIAALYFSVFPGGLRPKRP